MIVHGILIDINSYFGFFILFIKKAWAKSFIYRTVIRAHKHAVGGKKRSGRALGSLKGDFDTKVYTLVDDWG